MAKHKGDGSEAELVDQWAFLDAMVERQASQLRAGIQDEEETPEASLHGAQVSASSATETTIRVDALERECEALSAQLGARGRELKVQAVAAAEAGTKATAAHVELTNALRQRDLALAELQQRYGSLNAQLREAQLSIGLLTSQLARATSAGAQVPGAPGATAPPNAEPAAPVATSFRRWWRRR